MSNWPRLVESRTIIVAIIRCRTSSIRLFALNNIIIILFTSRIVYEQFRLAGELLTPSKNDGVWRGNIINNIIISWRCTARQRRRKALNGANAAPHLLSRLREKRQRRYASRSRIMSRLHLGGRTDEFVKQTNGDLSTEFRRRIHIVCLHGFLLTPPRQYYDKYYYNW